MSHTIQVLLDVILAITATHLSLHTLLEGYKHFKVKKQNQAELQEKAKIIQEQEQQRKMLELIKQNTSNKGS